MNKPFQKGSAHRRPDREATHCFCFEGKLEELSTVLHDRNISEDDIIAVVSERRSKAGSMGARPVGRLRLKITFMTAH